MHELLVEVTRMRLKSDFLAEVFVLWSMGNKLVPSSLMTNGSSMKVESIAECSKRSILQYF